MMQFEEVFAPRVLHAVPATTVCVPSSGGI